MLAHLPPIMGSRCLDVGCGSGIIGLHLARAGNDVWMGDIDARAVAAAKANAQRLGVRADIRCSDLFSAFVEERFDVVTFNTPYWHRPPRNADEVLSCDAGGALLLRFVGALPDILRPQGAAWFTVANLSDRAVLRQVVATPGLRIHLAAREDTHVAGIVRGLACARRAADSDGLDSAPPTAA
jgi:release factor glutamine methyltransferase